jgi:hypothetical protein
MYKYIKLLDLLKKNELVTYEMVSNVADTKKDFRMAIYRLRQKGYKISNVTRKGYIFENDGGNKVIRMTDCSTCKYKSYNAGYDPCKTCKDNSNYKAK